MLFVDKHRPTSLDRMDVHVDLSQQLKRLVQSREGDFPHLLLYGPSGAGKKTRVMAVLRQLFGSGAEKLKLESKTFKVGTKEISITTLASNYHIEVTPSDAGVSDRHVVTHLIKEIAQSAPVIVPDQQARGFKVVVLNEVDLLSRAAQSALRRTMEKYMASCRLILVATSTTKVLEPVRSRCLCVRVPAPTNDEIISVLTKIAKKENITLPAKFANTIVQASDRNLRRAILMLEASKVDQYPFKEDQQPRMPDWERFIVLMARDIIEEQSPTRLFEIRGKMYDLLSNCIPPDLIIRRLALELMDKLDATLKQEVAYWAAHYEHRMKLGSKHIFHLEAFVARFMSIYKQFIISSYE